MAAGGHLKRNVTHPAVDYTVQTNNIEQAINYKPARCVHDVGPMR